MRSGNILSESGLVSVVIPTYNRINEVIMLVDSLLLSDYRNIEIIVIDNNSSDDTSATITNKYTANGFPVKVITLEKNMMAAGGRNAGIEQAKGEYLLFIDSDNVVHPNMIDSLVNGFTNNPKLGFSCPIILSANEDNTVWTLGASISFWTSMPHNFCGGKKIEELRSKMNIEPYYPTDYSPNSFMVRREVIDQIGGFDEDYYIMFEEADFGYRIKKMNYEMLVNTNAITYHHSAINNLTENKKLRSLGLGTVQRTYHFMKNRTIFMKKFAPCYCLIGYYLFFIHALCLFYFITAITERRADIAIAVIKGTLRGLFIKTNKKNKIDINQR